MLILTTLALDVYGGIVLGCVTPLMALIRGQLPAVLWPAVPFIMTGNAILILLFALIAEPESNPSLLPRWQTWAGIVSAAAAKFIWLYATVQLLLPLLLVHPIPGVFIAMMAVPQLITALVGGTLALLFFTLLRQRRII